MTVGAVVAVAVMGSVSCFRVVVLLFDFRDDRSAAGFADDAGPARGQLAAAVETKDAREHGRRLPLDCREAAVVIFPQRQAAAPRPAQENLAPGPKESMF